MDGRIKSAISSITDTATGGPLSLNSFVDDQNPSLGTIREILVQKHPAGQPCTLLMSDTLPNDHDPHFTYFNQLDGELIRKMALKLEGAAGPSGIDAAGWRRLCTAFKTYSVDLCESVACLARRLCTSYVDPKTLTAFVSCHFIALNKNPGVRHIETLHRIMLSLLSRRLISWKLQVCINYVLVRNLGVRWLYIPCMRFF